MTPPAYDAYGAPTSYALPPYVAPQYGYQPQFAQPPPQVTYPPQSPAQYTPGQAARAQKLMGLRTDCCALCYPFADIAPVIHTEEGSYMNPLFDYVKRFHLALDPFPIVLGPAVGTNTFDASLVVQAEENHFGDLLISELMATSDTPATPNAGLGRILITMTSQQNDRTFMNAPVLDRFIFSNSIWSKNLPCCFLIQATNFLQVRGELIDTTVNTNFRMAARGTRFLPYANPELRDQLLAYWNQVKSIPYWLTIDRVQTNPPGVTAIPGGVRITAGSTATVFMTVPGSGDFELKKIHAACYPVPFAGSANFDPSLILTNITEGVGRSMFSRELPLGDFVAKVNRLAGSFFTWDEYRSAGSSNWQEPRQNLKRNTRVRVTLQNTSGAASVDVFLTFEGCIHYYDECPPGRSLQRALSLEPTIGPMLVQAPRCPTPASFEPMPGRGMVPTGGGIPRLVPPTGFTPPVVMPGFSGLGLGRPPRIRVELPDGGIPQVGGSW